MTDGETVRPTSKEQRENEALWVIGGHGFFDHGAINDSDIRYIVGLLAPTHNKEETFTIIQRGLQPNNLRTGIAYSWEDVAGVVSEIYTQFHHKPTSQR